MTKRPPIETDICATCEGAVHMGDRGYTHDAGPDDHPVNFANVPRDRKSPKWAMTGHGSPRWVSERAKFLHAELAQYAPQLSDPPTQLLTEDLSRVEALTEALFDSIMDEAHRKGDVGKVPTTRIQRFTELTGRKGRIMDAMGLSPQAKAKMVREASEAEVNRARLADEMREGLAAGAELTQKAIAEGRLYVEEEDAQENKAYVPGEDTREG